MLVPVLEETTFNRVDDRTDFGTQLVASSGVQKILKDQGQDQKS